MNENKYDDDGTTVLLKTIAQMLALIPTSDLRDHVASCRRSLNNAHSIGHIIDPTAYRNATFDGTLEDAQHQLNIAEALFKARVAIDEREAFVAVVQQKRLSK